MGETASREQATDFIHQLFREGVKAVDPVHAVTAAVRFDGETLRIGDREIDLRRGRVVVIAIGKAAQEMATGLSEVLGDRTDAGFSLTKAGARTNVQLPRFRFAYAAHPVPDLRGVEATREILNLVDDLGPEDVVIALISGGGSALLTAPRPPLELTDIQQTTDLLLRAGAPIQDLNAVRSELSLVKGGGLRRAIGEATCVSLILSDVLGNDPSIIASGPTVARRPDPARALALLDHYHLRDRVPQGVIALLMASAENSDAGADESRHPQDVWKIIADNGHFIEAMADAARCDGHRPAIIWRDREGEAADLAREFVDACANTPDDIDVVLGGGEATVTVRGEGIGGRNTEFALAAAFELERRKLPWVVASVASDGDDGANERSAGGIADAGLIARAGALGLDPVAALEANDSGTLLGRLGAMVASDPTGTNVNDAYIGIRLHAASEEPRETDAAPA